MTAQPPDVDFARIRAHETSQNRAWEELAYLLAYDLDGIDPATPMERRGTPDGGIEFSCVPSIGNGGRWAWQAKYLFGFGASTFTQMTKSVKAALASTPDLERYIFVLPKDLSNAGLATWKTNAAAWQREVAKLRPRRKIEFVFHGHSDVLVALLLDKHAGAVRYFFNERLLTTREFKLQVAKEVVDLGERYQPDVNVHTEARQIIDAACRSPEFVDRLLTILRSPGENTSRVERKTTEPVIVDGDAELARLTKVWLGYVDSIRDRLGEPGNVTFERLRDQAEAFQTGIAAQRAAAEVRHEALREEVAKAAELVATTKTGPRKAVTLQAEADQRTKLRDDLYDFESRVYRLQSDVDHIQWFLTTKEIDAATSGSVLLVGEAGCGKSHMVADVATERVAADQPALLVLGQRLQPGDIGAQIADIAGHRTMEFADLMVAFDVAARVRRNGRALLVVDAINEGAGAELWEGQIRGFLADLTERYPWVAVALTVRDRYEPLVTPHGIPETTVRAEHPGLAGHEEEALTIYAAYHGLRLPDVPAPLPELTNPLFLRSVCETVKDLGLKAIPREAGSLVWVFDGLVKAANSTLAKRARCDYDAATNPVGRAARALAGAMFDADSESLSVADATVICEGIHSSTRFSKSLLNGLVQEGLLLRERTDHSGTPTESVRFTYQRFSDHLRADVLLDRNPTDRELAAKLRAISREDRRWAMTGVIAALALLVPERRGRELSAVMRYGRRVLVSRYSYNSSWTDAHWLRNEVQKGFVESLMWRAPGSFTEGTLALLDGYRKTGVIEEYQWFQMITSLACVPDHPLNIERYDQQLHDISMADRDDLWSREILWVFLNDANPVCRTIDWAWANPQPPDDVLRLTGTFLAWLLTSPNRRLRDSATKALVQLHDGRTDQLAELVERFADVNDPYVVDRVVAAGLGHIMRHRHDVRAENIDAFVRLGQAIYDAVFATVPPTTHLSLRHNARTAADIVEGVCEKHGRTLGRDLSVAQPPYSSDWPLVADSARQLARRFGRTYNGYLGSATELDWEFERNFERRILSDLAVPNQTRARATRRRALQRKLDKAVEKLIEACAPSRREQVRRRVAELVSGDDAELGIPSHIRWAALQKSLSKKAAVELHDVRSTAHAVSRADNETVNPNTDLCTRWIAQRILELGWTKEQFGTTDETTAKLPGNETDRIAVKYQHIALQELCGRLADHCLIAEHWKAAPEPYLGPWQLSEALDADTSTVLRGDEPPKDTPAARLRATRVRAEQTPKWWKTEADHQLSDTGQNETWLGGTSDVPHPRSLVVATDDAGREWVALERHQEWGLSDPSASGEGYHHDWRVLTFHAWAYLMQADDGLVAPWAANEDWAYGRGLEDGPNLSSAYLGGYPDIEPWPYQLNLSDSEGRPYEEADPGTDVLPIGWMHFDRNGPAPIRYARTAVGYHQEASRDASTIDCPRADVPSRMILDLLGARWAGANTSPGTKLDLGPVEQEYSWLVGKDVVAFCTAGRQYRDASGLWVRAEPLRKALDKAGLGLWIGARSEKIYWDGHHPSSTRADGSAAIQLAPEPITTWGYTLTRNRGATRLITERHPGIPTRQGHPRRHRHP